MEGPSGVRRRPRETLLGTMLGTIAVASFAFAVFLICGGMAIGVVAVVGGVIGLALVNYFLWGHALLRSTVGERQDAEFQALLEDEGWNRPIERPHIDEDDEQEEQ